MFENPRRGRQARNFTTNVPKILDLKSSSEQFLKLPLGAPVTGFVVAFFLLFHDYILLSAAKISSCNILSAKVSLLADQFIVYLAIVVTA